MSGRAGQITRKEVAAAAGVSVYSVSQAIAGKPGVGKATRERILRIAEEMGYRPSLTASLLAGRKFGREGAISIVYVSRFWSEQGKSFSRCCQEVGIRGEVYWMDDFERPQQLMRILRARGVDGIFLNGNGCLWKEEDLRSCDWSSVPVLKYSRSLPFLPFHLIRHSAFDYMHLALSKLLEARPKRLAVILFESGSESDNEARLAAVLLARELAKGQACTIEWCTWKHERFDADDLDVLNWLEGYAPDAILAGIWINWYALYRRGWRFPEDALFAALMRPSAEEHVPELKAIAGCEMAEKEVNARAVALLAELISKGERGFPANPTELVVEPKWIDGETLG